MRTPSLSLLLRAIYTLLTVCSFLDAARLLLG